MGTYQDAVQGTVILAVTMVGAGLYGTLNTLIGMAVHNKSSFEFGTALV